MRYFDRPLTAEIFLVLVWVLFIGSALGIKLPETMSPANAWASPSPHWKLAP